MKATGITRSLDNLGRIVIPKEIRNSYEIEEGTKVEFFTTENSIIIKKYRKGCHCCRNVEIEATICGLPICKSCLKEFSDAAKIIDSIRKNNRVSEGEDLNG